MAASRFSAEYILFIKVFAVFLFKLFSFSSAIVMMDFQGRARSPLRAVFGQISAQPAAKGLAALL